MRQPLLALVSLSLLASSACGAPEAAPAPGENPRVVIDTSEGKITVELNAAKAPISVKNFLAYVEEKHYDNTVFHRVIGDFMIQGGGFESGMEKAKTPEDFEKLQKKTRAPIKNESGNGLSNVRGTIAMARTSELDSATSQFYINTVDNADKLDEPKYCVFGKVIEGMDVVNKIRAVETRAITVDVNGRKVPVIKDVPVKDVVIKSVRLVEKN